MHSQVVIEGQTVFAADGKSISAYGINSDSVLWRKEFENAFKFVGKTPLGLLVQLPPSKLTLLDIGTGEVIWQMHSVFSGNGFFDERSQTYWSPTNSAVLQIRLSDGEVLQIKQLSSHHVPFESKLEIASNGVLCRAGSDSAGTGIVAAYGPLDSALVWINKSSGSKATNIQFIGTAMGGDFVLFDQYEGEVLTLDAASGKVKLRLSASNSFPPLLAGDSTLVILDLKGNLCRFDLAKGSITWTCPLKGVGYSKSVLSGKKVWFIQDEATIRSVDFETGEKVDEISIGGQILSNLAIQSENIFVVSEDGFLYAVPLPK